jgi:hypothetical protein
MAIALTTTAYGDRIPLHRGKRCDREAVRAYHYQLHDDSTSVSIVAIAPADQPESVRTGAAPSRPPESAELLRKSFYVDRKSISADHVQLSRIAFAIYSDGRYRGSGMLRHDGGPHAQVQGANVTVRVRAYAGTPQHRGDLHGMRLVWETAERYWVRRSQSRAVSLVPKPEPSFWETQKGNEPCNTEQPAIFLSQLVEESFDEITHLEVVLERLKDR